MHGVTLTDGPVDWEIVQQEDGMAKVRLAGKYQVHPAAIEVGVESAVPVIRVMREADNMTVIPWTTAECIEQEANFSGTFETVIHVPAGGLYRIDTGLETKSTQPDLTWLYRGDCILHVGVGNLFLIAGQSNAAGYGRDFCPDPPHLCVHLFRNRGQWDLASHPMNESTAAGSLPNEEMGVPGVSPYLSFAKTYYESTRMPVGLIQTAQGGSPIARWNPADGDLYRNMMDRIKLTKGKYAGILWYQGCEDTKPGPAGSYYGHFCEIVKKVRESLGYPVPFFTMQLNRWVHGPFDEAWGMVREAQRRAAEEMEQVYILSTTNLNQSDCIHNSAPANVALGEKLARQCAHVLNGAEEFEAPALEQAEFVNGEEKEALGLTGIWMRLVFAHVKNCFMLYSAAGQDSGFTLTDSCGEVEIKRIRANREDKNRVYLQLARDAKGPAFLSFAWEADPVRMPLTDEVTCLPPLSFYQRRL